MITYEKNGINYQLKQTPSEFTIGEFEIVSGILSNSTLDKIDKYSQLFVSLGIPQDIVDDMDTSEFFDLIKRYIDFNDETDYLNSEKVKTIEIEDRTYQAYEDKFNLNVKQMRFIENFIKQNPTTYIGDLMAIIFKDTQLTSNEHFVDAHIRHKAKLFRKHVTVDMALPYIGYFSKELFNNITTYNNI